MLPQRCQPHPLRPDRSGRLASRRRGRRRRAAVVAHVRLDEMSGGERRAQTELAGQDAGGHDARELSGVVAWVRRVGASHAE